MRVFPRPLRSTAYVFGLTTSLPHAKVGLTSANRSVTDLVRKMTQPATLSKYAKLPKVELHLHLDGACRLTTLQDLSRTYGLPFPHDDLEKFRPMVSLVRPQPSLVEFLSVFENIAKILCTQEAVERVSYELVEDLSKQSVVYAEVRYNPMVGLAYKLSGDGYMQGALDGLERGEKDFGVKVRSILAFMREKPEHCLEIVKLAKKYCERGVVGVDIAGDELQPLDPRHREGFRLAREVGLSVTIHAAESGPASNVKQAVLELGATRIGHGYHVLDDGNIYALAKEKKIHFEVCPTSSIYTNAATLENHALKRFVADGVSFSLSTDDPAVCPCTLTGQFDIASDSIGLTDDQLVDSVLNGARASFLPQDQKDQLLEMLAIEIRRFQGSA